MKTTLKIFLFLVVAFGFSATAMAQGTATAAATVLTPISVTATTNMNFGNVIPSATPGTITLSASDNSRTADVVGGPYIATSNPGTVSAAIFTLAGQASASFAIGVPGSPVTLNGTPSGTMTVSDFTVDGGTTASMSAGGVATVKIGAKLNVGANQAAGSYISSGFSVTFQYN